MIPAAALEELKQRNPCDVVAGQWVTLRRGGKLGQVGPCPLHSPNPNARDSTAFECDAERWVCASCQDGGDVVKLVALHHGLRPREDFLEVVKLLGGAAELSADRAAELQRERALRESKREREANAYRERERRTAFDMWLAADSLIGSPAETYLREKRAIAELPFRPHLRFAPIAAYFHGHADNEIGRKVPRVVHRGPAMLAPIVDAEGRFRGVHMTWLDLARPSGKAAIADPDHAGVELQAKKVRGSQGGNAIRLVPGVKPRRLYLGEGIETVLSVWFALMRAGRSDDLGAAFWAGVSMGNIGGRSAESVPHPTLKDAAGRTRRVPGPAADPASRTIAIPDSVEDLILLGDGDSDRFTTQCALARAAERFNAPSSKTSIGRRVRAAWAPDGMDFNDVLRAVA